jgi:hypothetical protein
MSTARDPAIGYPGLLALHAGGRFAADIAHAAGARV